MAESADLRHNTVNSYEVSGQTPILLVLSNLLSVINGHHAMAIFVNYDLGVRTKSV